MNIKILHDQLVRRIRQFGNDAREHRQMYRRLTQLLPDRYQEISNRHRASGGSASDCSRLAGVSEEYIAHIDEVVEFCASSYEAKIQYETHMMLIDARRTLRSARNAMRKF